MPRDVHDTARGPDYTARWLTVKAGTMLPITGLKRNGNVLAAQMEQTTAYSFRDDPTAIGEYDLVL